LGIGLPDIVIFIGMILKGIYETSLNYGYPYDSVSEKYLIINMMKASLSQGDEWWSNNEDVDKLLSGGYAVSNDALKNEIIITSKLFAANMLVTKFIQGLPLIGIAGGVFNPLYYNRIMKYVRLKYYKRYLLDKLSLTP